MRPQPPDDLDRFVQAQESAYAMALAEIQSGRKQSHWMWYIFPQLRGWAAVTWPTPTAFAM